MPMAIGFIFMATRRDRTVPQARALIDEALTLGVANIGFKDIGLPRAALKELARAIRAGGARAFFEVVSLDRDSELASAAAAVDFGVDWLLGGVRASEVAPIAKSAGALYAPFPGAVVGHPSALVGAIEEIEASARALGAVEGVAGLDLLAYRHSGDVPALIRAVVGAVDKPVIVAGSINDAERIATVAASGAAGFTIGSAAIEGAFPAPSQRFSAQIRAIQRAVADLG
ncbi:MAG: 4-hydroxythreonine-4-phosphate dehydrogenase [Roseiarcus sp.]